MRYLLPLFLALMLAAPSYAAFSGSPAGAAGSMPSTGGFQGPSGGNFIDTVAKAAGAWDDTPVVLTGNIIEHMAGTDDKYIFRDATGQIMVDIDPEKFMGHNVTPQNKVRISGKVDKDTMRAAKIDVKMLEVLN